MSDLQGTADRVEIEALRGVHRRGHDTRLRPLRVLIYPRRRGADTRGGIELAGREATRAGIEQMQDMWEFFVQTTHPGAIQVDGDTATGRAYLCEVGRRLAEIHHRYGPGHLVSRSIQRATPMILSAVEQVHRRAARTA
jgi:hypothetical protein